MNDYTNASRTFAATLIVCLLAVLAMGYAVVVGL